MWAIGNSKSAVWIDVQYKRLKNTHIYIYILCIYLFIQKSTHCMLKKLGMVNKLLLDYCFANIMVNEFYCVTVKLLNSEIWGILKEIYSRFRDMKYSEGNIVWMIVRCSELYSEWKSDILKDIVGSLWVPSFIIPIFFFPIALKNPRVGWKILSRFLSNGSAAVLKQLCVDQFGPAQQVGYHSQPPHECCWVIMVIHADEIRLQIITTNPSIQNSAGSWNSLSSSKNN